MKQSWNHPPQMCSSPFFHVLENDTSFHPSETWEPFLTSYPTPSTCNPPPRSICPNHSTAEAFCSSVSLGPSSALAVLPTSLLRSPGFQAILWLAASMIHKPYHSLEGSGWSNPCSSLHSTSCLSPLSHDSPTTQVYVIPSTAKVSSP